MLPKKNIGAIIAMSSFLGLIATHIFTAAVYYSCRDIGAFSQSAAAVFGFIGLVELLLVAALAVGFGMLFVFGEDLYSAGHLGASALLAILTIAVRFDSVSANPSLFGTVTFLMNLSILLIFGIYALYYYRKDIRSMAVLSGASGIWVAFVSIAVRSVINSKASPDAGFAASAVISLISAVCYGIAYYSQRQSFE